MNSRIFTGNRIAAAILVATGAVFLVQMANLAASSDSSDPGAGGYPSLLAVLLIGLAILLLFQHGTGEPMPGRAGLVRVASAVALLVGYQILMGLIGYIAATALFLVGALLLLGTRRPIPLIVVPVVFSVTIFVLFYTVFGVALPRGPIEGLIS